MSIVYINVYEKEIIKPLRSLRTQRFIRWKSTSWFLCPLR